MISKYPKINDELKRSFKSVLRHITPEEVELKKDIKKLKQECEKLDREIKLETLRKLKLENNLLEIQINNVIQG